MDYSLANIPMNNYLIAASSPLTESVERLLCCEKAHFAAAILKSCADYVRTGTGYGRKVIYVTDGFYADSSYEHEILTLDEGKKLYSEAMSSLDCNMLLIPSISASTLDPLKWIEIALEFQKLGAKLIQLDFFYLGTINHTNKFYEELRYMLTTMKKTLNCAIMPKLNIQLNAERTFEVIKKSGVHTVSLLDSMREDPDIKCGLHRGTTSYFGPRELPYTKMYLEAAKKYGLEVCAGGGITSREDVLDLLNCGANMIQVASYVLNRDFSSTQDLLPISNYDFSNSILKHNPWCDYISSHNCDQCGACAKHIIR